MRQKTLDLTKKIITVFLACLMLLVMLPSGWLFRRHAPQETLNEMQKVYPVMSTFVSQNSPDVSPSRMEDGLMWVGNGNEGYMQFSLSETSGTAQEELRSAKLRLMVVDSVGESPREIRTAKIKNNNWNLSMTYRSRPQGEEEMLTAVQETAGKGSILEIDLTAAVKNWLQRGEQTVTLHFYGSDLQGTAFASEYHPDSALHPYLKLLWGEAVDTDLSTSAKAELMDTIYVSSEEPEASGSALLEDSGGLLSVDDAHTAYLKFRLNRQNIRGAVAKATLVLHAENAENAILLPSLLENSQWNSSMNYSERPPGKMEPFGSYRVTKGVFALDVTQAVSEQFQENAGEITFILEGTGQSVFSGIQSTAEYRPYLRIETSENPNVVAAHETMVNLLKNNLSEDNITSDLRGSYTADIGARATVDWQVYDALTGEEDTAYIAVTGEVTRPKWFEGEKKLRAVANIQSGNCAIQRTLVLTLPPETVPSYDENQFTDTVIIGDEKSEETQGFAYVRGSRVKTRNVKGKGYTYRTLEKDGAMVVSLRCDSEKANRLYIKLWGEDVEAGSWYICDPELGAVDPAVGPENDDVLWIPMTLTAKNVMRGEDGFVYAFFDIPECFTKGKNSISIRLFRKGGTVGGSLLNRSDEGRGIYAISLKSE